MSLSLALILISLFSIASAQYDGCPTITCSDDDYVEDLGGYCLELQDKSARPYQSTWKIRECKGETKKYCMWGRSSTNGNYFWPVS